MFVLLVLVSVLSFAAYGMFTDGSGCTIMFSDMKVQRCDNATYANVTNSTQWATDCNTFADCMLLRCNASAMNPEYANATYTNYAAQIMMAFQGPNNGYGCDAAAVASVVTAANCACAFGNTGWNFTIGTENVVALNFGNAQLAGDLSPWCTSFNQSCNAGVYVPGPQTTHFLTVEFIYVANKTFQPTFNTYSLAKAKDWIMNYTIDGMGAKVLPSQFSYNCAAPGCVVMGNGTLNGTMRIELLTVTAVSSVNMTLRTPAFRSADRLMGNLTIGISSYAAATTTTTTTTVVTTTTSASPPMFGSQVMIVAAVALMSAFLF